MGDVVLNAKDRGYELRISEVDGLHEIDFVELSQSTEEDKIRMLKSIIKNHFVFDTDDKIFTYHEVESVLKQTFLNTRASVRYKGDTHVVSIAFNADGLIVASSHGIKFKSGDTEVKVSGEGLEIKAPSVTVNGEEV